jgi:CheY-like chemotaxis protein
VVAFTAHVTQDDIARALAVGCSAVIAKPFEIAAFLQQIATVLVQHAPGRQRAIGTGLTAPAADSTSTTARRG